MISADGVPIGEAQPGQLKFFGRADVPRGMEPMHFVRIRVERSSALHHDNLYNGSELYIEGDTVVVR